MTISNCRFVFFFLIASVVSACSKPEKPEPKPPAYTPAGTNINKDLSNAGLTELQSALEGKWYLLGSGGGISGKQFYNYSGIYHIFGKDTFTVNNNGKITKYACKWTKSNFHADSVYQLERYGDGIGMIFLRIVNDTLSAMDNAYDGFGYSYLKIK